MVLFKHWYEAQPILFYLFVVLILFFLDFKMCMFYLGLNLKNTGIFSKGLRTPWFGMAVIREVMTLVLPWAHSPPVISSARATSVLRVKSTPWRSPNFSLLLYHLIYWDHCNTDVYGIVTKSLCSNSSNYSFYIYYTFELFFNIKI